MTTKLVFSIGGEVSAEFCPQAVFKGVDCISLKQHLVETGKENWIGYFNDTTDEKILKLNGVECKDIVELVEKYPALKVVAFFDHFMENKIRETTIVFSESYYNSFITCKYIGLSDGQSDCPFSEEVDILSESEKIYKGTYSFNGKPYKITYEFPFKKEWNRCVEERTYLPLSEEETIIEDSAFENNNKLLNVKISENVKKIGKKAFSNCAALNKIELPSGLKKIEDSTFSSCEFLQTIVIPETVSNIGNSAFKGCDRLKEITFPVNLKKIGSTAFYGCNILTNIVFPQDMTKIGKNAFKYCDGIKEIEIPGSIKKVEEGVFSNCWSLSKVVISEGVECIEKNAFKHCSKLESITIPLSLTKIDASAFEECFKLKRIVVPNPNAVINGNIRETIEVIRPGLED